MGSARGLTHYPGTAEFEVWPGAHMRNGAWKKTLKYVTTKCITCAATERKKASHANHNLLRWQQTFAIL